MLTNPSNMIYSTSTKLISSNFLQKLLLDQYEVKGLPNGTGLVNGPIYLVGGPTRNWARNLTGCVAVVKNSSRVEDPGREAG